MGSAGSDVDDEVARAIASVYTESGANLLALTEASPVLLVFLRYFGCPFCRKTIDDISQLRGELEARGVRPVFVHLGTSEIAKANFDYYGLNDVERINDPQAAIYRHPVFMLGRMSPGKQMLKPTVWVGWMKGWINKYGIVKDGGDDHQMAGIFFLKGPKIARKFIHRSMADQPDYLRLVA
jgi:hypothetical protein